MDSKPSIISILDFGGGANLPPFSCRRVNPVRTLILVRTLFLVKTVFLENANFIKGAHRRSWTIMEILNFRKFVKADFPKKYHN